MMIWESLIDYKLKWDDSCPEPMRILTFAGKEYLEVLWKRVSGLRGGLHNGPRVPVRMDNRGPAFSTESKMSWARRF